MTPSSATRSIRSLPDWFGNDQGIAEAAAAVRAQAGLVSVLDGAVVGFLTWKRHHPTAAEITWLAVHADHRGGGTGTALVEELVASAGALRYLTVKTLSACLRVRALRGDPRVLPRARASRS